MGFHVSQRSVEALKPPAKGTHSKVFYDDKAAGFGVRVSEAGVKSFVLNYSIAGRERRFTIGRWPEWSADAARKEAGELRVAINKGVDPLGDKQTARGENTMAELAKRYIDDYAKPNKRPKSIREDRRLLDKLIVPKLGRLCISAVKRIDVERLHNSLRATPFQANRVLSLLKKMFACALDWELRPDNPARKIKKFAERKRETWLSGEQLRALSGALDDYSEQDAANAIRLLIVTGSRPGEVIGATWPMFDLQRGIWTKPSHKTKQNKDEHVPLNPSALGILRRMAQHKTDVHLFPGRDPGTARTTLRNAWNQVCRAAGLANEYSVVGKRGKPLRRWKASIRAYDLRHSFASHLIQRNWSLELVGKLLGHVRPETTQRYAHVADAALRNVTNDFGAVLGPVEAVQEGQEGQEEGRARALGLTHAG